MNKFQDFFAYLDIKHDYCIPLLLNAGLNKMKKVKIPLEILYKLFNNKIELGLKSKADLKADRIIEQNKKYFNHIGVA